MSLSIKNKKAQILLFSLTTTVIILALNRNSISESFQKLPLSLRNLVLKEDYAEKRCEKAHKKLLEKYNEKEFSKVEFKELTKYQKILKEMIEEKDFKKAKNYLKRVLIYIIFVIVEVLLIIFWFVFCGCCCCCKRNSSQGCFKCNFLIFFLLSIIVILICIGGYIFTPCFYKSINNVLCSFYKLINHFIRGTNEDFPNSSWEGFEGIKNLQTKYDENINQIKKLKPLTENSECQEDLTQLCQNYDQYLDQLENDGDEKFIKSLDKVIDQIEKVSKTFTDIEKDNIGSVEDNMEYFDKYCKLGLFLLFSVILGFCFFSLLALTGYFVCNIKCLSCLFHVCWNLEMLFIIITMLIGICFGIIGIVSKDAVSLLKFTASSANLNSSDIFLLDIDDDYREKIDICFNKNGNLSYALEGINGVFGEQFEANFSTFEEEYKKAKGNPQFKDLKAIPKAYDELYIVFKNFKELYEDLNKDNLTKIVNCEFVGWDFKIITDELNDSLAKTLVLFSMIIIVADLVGVISIFFGIIVVSNERSPSEPEVLDNNSRQVKIHLREDKNNMDSSSANLRK